MTWLVKKLHVYTGLVNVIVVMVFGVAGLQATLQMTRLTVDVVETRGFDPPPNTSDQEVAAAAVRALGLSGAPPAANAVRRDADQNLTFTAYTMNGPRTITVLEADRQVRVVVRRNRLVHFFDNLHAASPREAGAASLPLRLWSWYIEFSIWSLIVMSVSGVWLWLASRPGYRWAQVAFGVGGGGFLILYAVMRW